MFHLQSDCILFGVFHELELRYHQVDMILCNAYTSVGKTLVALETCFRYLSGRDGFGAIYIPPIVQEAWIKEIAKGNNLNNTCSLATGRCARPDRARTIGACRIRNSRSASGGRRPADGCMERSK
jgi:hypothetical protein